MNLNFAVGLFDIFAENAQGGVTWLNGIAP
jgi:hypothetical protein